MPTTKDIVYLAITGSILTEAFSYEEFLNIRCPDYVSYPFESWCEQDLVDHIHSIANNILNQIN